MIKSNKILNTFLNAAKFKLKLTDEQLVRTEDGSKFENIVTEAMYQGFKLNPRNGNTTFNYVIARMRDDGVPSFTPKPRIHNHSNSASLELRRLAEAFPDNNFTVYQAVEDLIINKEK